MDLGKNGNGKAPVYEVDLDDRTDQSTSQVVVRGIAELTDRDPEALEPLWDSVDPEALDSFVAHASEASTPYRLSFRYHGYTVEVENRSVRFIPTEEAPSSASA